MPAEVRLALGIKPRQQLTWEIQNDGSAIVRLQPSALELFGSLKPAKRFPGLKAEKEASRLAVAQQAAKEGLE